MSKDLRVAREKERQSRKELGDRLAQVLRKFPTVLQEIEVLKADSSCTCSVWNFPFTEKADCTAGAKARGVLEKFISEFPPCSFPSTVEYPARTSSGAHFMAISHLKSDYCIRDLAVLCAEDLLRTPLKRLVQHDCQCFNLKSKNWEMITLSLDTIAKDLLRLLLKDEAMWPGSEFSMLPLKLRQIGVATAYAGTHTGFQWRPYSKECDYGFLTEIKREMGNQLSYFRKTYSNMVEEGLWDVHHQLKDAVEDFQKGLQDHDKLIRHQSKQAPTENSGGDWTWEHFLSYTEFLRARRDAGMESLAQLVAKASRVSEVLADDTNGNPESSSSSDASVDSWSFVPAEPADAAEVGSMASMTSADSEVSHLSGHGGPHCFLPRYLFQHAHVKGQSSLTTLLMGKDLTRGTKIVAADGTLLEVIKVEAQKTTRLIELEIDAAVPFTATPNHRILVPSLGGDDATVKAIDLNLGDAVMCNDFVASKVVGKREYLVEEQDVLAVTFHPDKPVACFRSPDEPVVLTKGLTRKPQRRGKGAGARGSEDDVSSIPDTDRGDYGD